MMLDGFNYPDVLIKIGKKEYLIELLMGSVYFKQADYFRKYEITKGFDSREGKVRVNPKDLSWIDDPIVKLVMSTNPEEVNISSMFSGKTPIFCCSEIDSSVLKSVGSNEYCLSDAFVDEMKQWGSVLIVMSKDELCSKVEKRCIQLGIKPLMSRIKYDQEDIVANERFQTRTLKINRYQAFFHKTKEYSGQNEFRIVLGNESIIGPDSCHYILNVGKLELAMIFDLDNLSDLVFKPINNMPQKLDDSV